MPQCRFGGRDVYRLGRLSVWCQPCLADVEDEGTIPVSVMVYVMTDIVSAWPEIMIWMGWPPPQRCLYIAWVGSASAQGYHVKQQTHLYHPWAGVRAACPVSLQGQDWGQLVLALKQTTEDEGIFFSLPTSQDAWEWRWNHVHESYSTDLCLQLTEKLFVSPCYTTQGIPQSQCIHITFIDLM